LEGFRLNWANRFFRITLLLSTLEVLVGEALMFTVLPRYIREIADVAGAGWIESIPLVGDFLAGLATPAGAFGLYLAVSALGLGLASALMAVLRPPKEGEPSKPGRFDGLERQAMWTSFMYGAGSLAFLGAFLVTNLWLSAGLMLVSSFLHAPAMVVWESVHQKVRREHHPDRTGVIISARAFYHTVTAIVGLLLFGAVLAGLATSTVILAAGVILSLIALVHFIEPFLVFPLRKG
jgi:hypothetical protein